MLFGGPPRGSQPSYQPAPAEPAYGQSEPATDMARPSLPQAGGRLRRQGARRHHHHQHAASGCSIWCRATAGRCATASASAVRASPGPASMTSPTSASGRIGRRRTRCSSAGPICRATWPAVRKIRSARARCISARRSTASTARTSPGRSARTVSSGCIRMRNEDVIDLYEPRQGRHQGRRDLTARRARHAQRQRPLTASGLCLSTRRDPASDVAVAAAEIAAVVEVAVILSSAVACVRSPSSAHCPDGRSAESSAAACRSRPRPMSSMPACARRGCCRPRRSPHGELRRSPRSRLDSPKRAVAVAQHGADAVEQQRAADHAGRGRRRGAEERAAAATAAAACGHGRRRAARRAGARRSRACARPHRRHRARAAARAGRTERRACVEEARRPRRARRRRLAFQLADAGIGALERFVLHQHGLHQRIGGIAARAADRR